MDWPDAFGDATEDGLLTRIAVEQALSILDPADAEMLVLIYRIYQPTDWTTRWPPTYDQVGHYIGMKYEGKPLSEAAIRYRRDAVFARFRGERGELRRSRR